MVEVEAASADGIAARDADGTGWGEGAGESTEEFGSADGAAGWTAKRRGGADRAASVSALTGTYFVPAAFNASICWRVASSSWRKASDMTPC